MSSTQLANGVGKAAGQEDDICPVCKSSRYLNPNMRFLINPECYHRMCESCVDRIFSQGPAPCPVAGCGRTLRKQRFKIPTFENLKIEREMDIRKKFPGAFGREETEFETLRQYNDYLEEVENLISNLKDSIDVPASEARLNTLASAKADIKSGNGDSNQGLKSAEDEGSGLRGGYAAKLANTKIDLKKSTARKLPGGKKPFVRDLSATSKDAATSVSTAPVQGIKGLKPIRAPAAPKPYDPFDGVSIEWQYHTARTDYEHPWLEKAKTDPMITAGGYDVGEYRGRALLEAFEGLGVFVEDEVGERDKEGVENGDASSLASPVMAQLTEGKGGGDDVF